MSVSKSEKCFRHMQFDTDRICYLMLLFAKVNIYYTTHS